MHFSASKVGDDLKLRVTNLSSKTTYHYAVRQRTKVTISVLLHASGSTARARTRRDTVAPGRVMGIKARPLSRRSIQLVFEAAASDGRKGPVVTRYVIKQSTRLIRNNTAFKRAPYAVRQSCSFDVDNVGDRLILKITDLRPNTTYYYAVQAIDEAANSDALEGGTSAYLGLRPLRDTPGIAAGQDLQWVKGGTTNVG